MGLRLLLSFIKIIGILSQWIAILASAISKWKPRRFICLKRAENCREAIKHCIRPKNDSNPILRRPLTVSLQLGVDITNISFQNHPPGGVEKETRLMHLSDCSIQQAQPETDLEEIGLKFLTFQSQDVVEPSADVPLRSTVESQPVDSEKLTASDVVQRRFQSENKHDSDTKSTSELSHGMSAPFPDKIRIRVSENESGGGNVRITDEQSCTKPQTGEPSQTQHIMPAKSNKISSDTITRSRDQNAPAQEDYAKAVTTKQRETPPPSDHDKKKQKEKKCSKERMDSKRSKDSTTLPSRMTSSEQQESPIMSSSTLESRRHHIKWVGFDTAPREELGERCFFCAEDLVMSPVPDEFGLEFHNFPDVAVLSCKHAFHTQCLQFFVSEEQMIDPQCVLCLS